MVLPLAILPAMAMRKGSVGDGDGDRVGTMGDVAMTGRGGCDTMGEIGWARACCVRSKGLWV